MRSNHTLAGSPVGAHSLLLPNHQEAHIQPVDIPEGKGEFWWLVAKPREGHEQQFAEVLKRWSRSGPYAILVDHPQAGTGEGLTARRETLIWAADTAKAFMTPDDIAKTADFRVSPLWRGQHNGNGDWWVTYADYQIRFGADHMGSHRLFHDLAMNLLGIGILECPQMTLEELLGHMANNPYGTGGAANKHHSVDLIRRIGGNDPLVEAAVALIEADRNLHEVRSIITALR